MFYSSKYNFLFIAIPKTGSITVEKALLAIDPVGENHSLTVNNKVYKGKDFQQGIVGHARAKDIRPVIGEEYFDQLNTIAMVRNPYAKLVSAYAFNRQNSLFPRRKMKGEKKLLLRRIKHFLTVAIAKCLPFYLWAFIYPYKFNYDYIFDEQDNRLVKYLGRTEHLANDLIKILKDIGLNTDELEIGHKNKSKHDYFEKYYSNRLFKKLIRERLKKDIYLYEQVTASYEDGV